ncbi:TetR family transcriptional regulator [Sneathiella sp. P13V-1]|uniref:acrylate utilization transcriptional regulator AcuR n=1 Tax=Sneathiella sp. P13V-1 TaxID=2697366 RepID=UPI00187B7F39|nr:TetR/AcrR family transcriptional regulator [Sneathiella sp. P13V-1]MBE7635561.1 TetR family transcriptional regulator [Sneathiella sp. P13V-1]
MTDKQPIKRGRGRPPKVHEGEWDTKQRLIRHGTAVLTEKGFASTGIDQILKEAGIPKGSFYHYFDSKDDFGLAMVANYKQYFANRLDRFLLNKEKPALDRLQDFINDAKSGLERFDFKRGCLVGNLGQELASLSDTFREPLEEIFQDWQCRVKACLDEAVIEGSMDNRLDTAEMAATFWIGWEGAILRSKLVRSTAPVDLFAKSFFRCLSSDPYPHHPKKGE